MGWTEFVGQCVSAAAAKEEEGEEGKGLESRDGGKGGVRGPQMRVGGRGKMKERRGIEGSCGGGAEGRGEGGIREKEKPTGRGRKSEVVEKGVEDCKRMPRQGKGRSLV